MELKTEEGPLKARLVTYKDPLTGKVFRFLGNLFDFQSHTIVLLYKNRWEIEPFFNKSSKTLSWAIFFSDSRDGIKTQVWMVLIAHLIFSVIHKRIKEAEQLTTLVSMVKGQPDILCLLPDHTKNQLPGSRAGSGKWS